MAHVTETVDELAFHHITTAIVEIISRFYQMRAREGGRIKRCPLLLRGNCGSVEVTWPWLRCCLVGGVPTYWSIGMDDSVAEMDDQILLNRGPHQ